MPLGEDPDVCAAADYFVLGSPSPAICSFQNGVGTNRGHAFGVDAKADDCGSFLDPWNINWKDDPNALFWYLDTNNTLFKITEGHIWPGGYQPGQPDKGVPDAWGIFVALKGTITDALSRTFDVSFSLGGSLFATDGYNSCASGQTMRSFTFALSGDATVRQRS